MVGDVDRRLTSSDIAAMQRSLAMSPHLPSEQLAWLRAYSPYHNVKPGTKYPAVLFTAGENDSRVHPLHARKMAALMQSATTSDPAAEPILLYVDRDAGHGQGKPLAARIKEATDQWSFLMWQTGLCK